MKSLTNVLTKRRQLGLGLFATGWYFDEFHNHRAVQRNLKSFVTALQVLYIYKVKWNAENTSECHRSAAQAILDTCKTNSGLYIKFGQTIASFNHILPPEFRKVFESLHDRAPTVSFEEVEKIIVEQLGQRPSELFAEFEQEP